MRFDPNAASGNLIPSGTWCQADIVSAVDTYSKSGNEMIKVEFQTYDSLGFHPILNHYFVATQPGFLKKLCLATDIDFSSGDIPAEKLVGKKLWVLIKIQEDKTGQFQDKNVVAAFSKDRPADAIVTVAKSPEETQDKDIPF